MKLTLPLEEMSTEEKIQTMESIWDNLCKNAENIKSPPWHEKTLQNREQSLKNKEEQFLNWTQAKRNIQNSV